MTAPVPPSCVDPRDPWTVRRQASDPVAGARWPGTRRGRRCARRDSRGPRRSPCRRRGALPGVLPPAGDGRGETGVQWRAVEPVRRTGRSRPPAAAAPLSRARAAARSFAPMPPLSVTGSGEGARLVIVQVPGPLGQDQAVPALASARDVGEDLAAALVAGDQVRVDGGHPAGRGRAGWPVVTVGGRVEVKDRRGPSAGRAAGQHVRAVGGLPGRGDSVPDRADLHADQVVELVAPVGGGGQPEPPPGGDLPDGVLERGGRDVVALIATISPYPAVSSAMSRGGPASAG